ncbi:MAG: diacylglycerol kinase [Hyphomicrobium sp.]
MKNRGMRQRLGFAWEGIAAAWRNERSFRIQTLFALALPAALLLLRVSAVWWALCLTIAFLVLAAELFNTALESLIDHLHPEIHPAIKLAKDTAAGAVLLLSISAVIVGVLAVLVALGVLT